MASYFMRRLAYAIIVTLLASFVSFLIIDLPPGNYITYRIQQLQQQGDESAAQMVDTWTRMYGLDRPLLERYWIWISRFVRGDFGDSFEFNRPVRELIGDRLWMTLAVALASIFVVWTVAIVAGVTAAVHQYRLADQAITTLSFVGLGTPPFLLALLVLYFAGVVLEMNVGGLFSPEFRGAAWSFAKFIDLLKHIWVPALIGAVTGAASLIRIMRGNLLDTLGQPFVEAARARGLRSSRVTWKHAVRIAILPLVVILGTNTLPQIIAGNALVAMVLNLPTIGPLYIEALRSQDMYMAGTVLVFLVFLTAIGALITDFVLMALDPRIRVTKTNR